MLSLELLNTTALIVKKFKDILQYQGRSWVDAMFEKKHSCWVFYICLCIWLFTDVFVAQNNGEFCFDANNQGILCNLV